MEWPWSQGFIEKSKLFSLINVCYFSISSLGLTSYFKHALLSSSAFLDPCRRPRNLRILTTQCLCLSFHNSLCIRLWITYVDLSVSQVLLLGLHEWFGTLIFFQLDISCTLLMSSWPESRKILKSIVIIFLFSQSESWYVVVLGRQTEHQVQVQNG